MYTQYVPANRVDLDQRDWEHAAEQACRKAHNRHREQALAEQQAEVAGAGDREPPEDHTFAALERARDVDPEATAEHVAQVPGAREQRRVEADARERRVRIEVHRDHRREREHDRVRDVLDHGAAHEEEQPRVEAPAARHAACVICVVCTHARAGRRSLEQGG